MVGEAAEGDRKSQPQHVRKTRGRKKGEEIPPLPAGAFLVSLFKAAKLKLLILGKKSKKKS